VHGIEPQPGPFRTLRTAVGLAGGGGIVRVHRHALAERAGHAWMSVPRRGGLPVPPAGVAAGDPGAHIAKYGHHADDVVALLTGLGYSMHAWFHGGWRPVDDVTPRRRNYLFLGRESGRAAGAACSATSAA